MKLGILRLLNTAYMYLHQGQLIFPPLARFPIFVFRFILNKKIVGALIIDLLAWQLTEKQSLIYLIFKFFVACHVSWQSWELCIKTNDICPDFESAHLINCYYLASSTQFYKNRLYFQEKG